MTVHDVDVAVVGAGFAGLLVASELSAAGRDVHIVERGGLKPHPDQLRDRAHELALATTEHNHEPVPGEDPYPWNYVYGVGGSSLHWTGVAPRLLPSDFRLQAEHGVGRDWPLSYDDLEPFYARAERILHVAGGDSPLFPRSEPLPQPQHPFSPVDQLVAEALPPVLPLPQARPTVSVNGRPQCCGNTGCALCPVDARTSMLHVLDDERQLDRPTLSLHDGTAVARLDVAGDRVAALDCIDRGGRRSTLRAHTVVLAANGLENAALLLRSDLGGEHVGRWLFDHSHRLVSLELDRPIRPGVGSAHITAASYAYADGDWRDRRASQLVLPFNQGLLGSQLVKEAVITARGRVGRAALRERFERTLVLDILGEDLPNPGRSVELSPRRDALGLPRTRVRYAGDSDYLRRARETLIADVEQRFRGAGGRVVSVERAGEGSHQLGTCFMGSDGVVDADLRHQRLGNLFIVGGSAFPSYSAHHPTLTICALALRLGQHLAAA